MKSFSKLMVGAFAATVAALAMAALFHGASWGKDAAPVINVESTPVNRAAAPVTSYAPIVKKAAPSVVNIYTTRVIHLQARGNPFANNPYFRQFFGNQSQDDSRELTQKEQILGSGVIISPDGYILTANHVVSGEEEIKVAFGDGSKKQYTATVVGTDPQTDIAVLKIDATNLPAITLGDSDQLEVGDVVLAIGNPYGMGQSVTMGIVSGLGRHYKDMNGYQDFIQTDAAINEGNSGGALVDAEGRLVGINTWIATETGGSVGLGFSVPVNMARHVMERLIAGGKVSRGYLGVYLQDIDAGLATYFSLPNQDGALVDDIDIKPGAPAAKAGIQSGDVIVSFNDKPVTDANNLILDVSGSLPGTEVTLKLIRDGSAKTVNVTLGEKPGEVAQNTNVRNNSKPASSGTDALDGVTIADLDQATRRQLRIPNTVQGVLVTDVAQDSNSSEAGLQPGDIIVEINRQPAGNAENAINLSKLAKGDQIILKIWRRDDNNNSSTRYLSVDNTKD